MFPQVHDSNGTRGQQTYLRMITEPESKFRFRYASESGSHGGILGKGRVTAGKKSKKSFPTVKLENYHGKKPVVIRASLYTQDKEKHVLELKGKSVKNGMSYQNVGNDYTATFNDLVIVNKKKDEVHAILMERKINSLGRITGSAREECEKKYSKELKSKAKEILCSALLCFEAFPKDNESKPICHKLFSELIYNKKSSLKITLISRVSGSCRGNDDVIILCDKVKKDTVKVLFFECDNEVAWEDQGVFSPADVHHQVAIPFKTPPYKENVEKTVKVCLCQEDDKSESVEFTYIPDYCNLVTSCKKRKINDEEEFQDILNSAGVTPSSSSNDASSEAPMDEMSVPLQNYILGVHDFEQAEGNNYEDLLSIMGIEIETPDKLCDVLKLDPSICNSPYPFEDADLPFNNPLPESSYDYLETDGECHHTQDTEIQSMSLTECPLETESIHSHSLIINQSMVSFNTDVGSFNQSKTNVSADILAKNMKRITLCDRGGARAEMTCESKIDFDSLRLRVGENSSGLEQNKNVKSTNCDISAQMDADSVLKLHSCRDSNRTSSKEEKPESRKFSKLQEIFWDLLHFRDISNNTVLHLTVSLKKFKLFLMLDKIWHTNILNAQNNRRQTAFHIATEKKNGLFMDLLLKYGADPNVKDVDGNNCLHIATKHNFLEGLDKILHSPRFQEVNSFNYEGLTPLHLAVIHHSEACFNTLVKYADLNVLEQKSGRSHLHFAINMLPFASVEYLLEQGSVDVNVQDFSGNSALHLACSIGNLQIVELLLEHDADPLLKNFKQRLETNQQENSDSEMTSNFFDVNIKEIPTKVDQGQTPLDVATDHRIREVLQTVIRKMENEKHSKSEQSKDSIDASGMFQHVELCSLLDNQLDIVAWKNIVHCLGMDESCLDTMLKCSSPSPSTAVLNYLKKKYEQNYMEVFQNVLEIAAQDVAVKLVKRMQS